VHFDATRGRIEDAAFEGSMASGPKGKQNAMTSQVTMKLAEDSRLDPAALAALAPEADAEALVERAVVSARAKKGGEATADLKKALEIAPASSHANRVLLQVEAEAGDYRGALDCLRRERQHRPKGPLLDALARQLAMAVGM